MTLSVAAGRITIQDADGTLVFDSDERLFVATDFVSGSVVIPARVGQTTGSNFDLQPNINSNTLLASVNPSANTVRGAFFASSSGSHGVVNVGWFNASGTYLHFQRGATLCAYTFFCNAGGLYVNERSLVTADQSFSPTTQTITVLSTTLSYKLFCGAWV